MPSRGAHLSKKEKTVAEVIPSYIYTGDSILTLVLLKNKKKLLAVSITTCVDHLHLAMNADGRCMTYTCNSYKLGEYK